MTTAFAAGPGAAGSVAAAAPREAVPAVVPDAAAWSLVIRFERDNEVTLVRQGDELLLRFRYAAPEVDLAAVQRRGARWIAAVESGHDTLLFKLQSGVQVQDERVNTATGNTLALLFAQPGPAGTDPARGADPEGAWRLDLLRARLAAQEGRLADARAAYVALAAQRPDAVEPRLGLADLDARTGRWRRAQDTYAAVLARDAGDPGVADAQRRLALEHGGSLGLEFESRNGSDTSSTATSDVRLVTAQGWQRMGPAWRLGAETDTQRVQADAVARADGNTAPLRRTLTRGGLLADLDTLDGWHLQAGLLGGPAGAGAEGLVSHADDFGTWRARLEGHQSDFAYAETFASEAWHDRVALGRNQRVALGTHQQLTLDGELGYTRYGVDADHDAARSTSARADALWAWQARPDTSAWGLHYALDLEHFSSLAQVVPATGGAAVARLALTDRQVHRLATTWQSAPFGQFVHLDWSARAEAGYAKDVDGHGGPVASMELTGQAEAWTAWLRGVWLQDVGSSLGTSSALVAGLRWHF